MLNYGIGEKDLSEELMISRMNELIRSTSKDLVCNAVSWIQFTSCLCTSVAGVGLVSCTVCSYQGSLNDRFELIYKLNVKARKKK